MSQSQRLPTGWQWATLGDVVEPVEQHGPGDGATFQYVDIGAVDNADKRIVEARTLPVSVAPSRARQNMRAGDVLVSMTRPNLNAVALVPDTLDGAVASTGFHVLRAQNVDPRWLFAAVRAPDFVESMTRLVQGALYPAVRPADVRAYRLPIPPLAEQRRIVAKLDELLASSRAARAALDAVPALLEQYRQAVLAAAFAGELTADWRLEHSSSLGVVATPQEGIIGAHDNMPVLPSTWRYVPIENIAQAGTVVTYGIVLPGPEVPNGVPYVRQQDIEDGQVKVDALGRTSHVIAAKHSRSTLQEGDVLLCIIRHLRVAVVPAGIDGANITQGTVRIRPAPFITSAYLAAYLSGPVAQAWMKRCYIGMAMPRINVKDARAVPVAVPPLEEQHEIMRRVSTALSAVERQLTAVDEMRGRLVQLEQSVLSKSFRGDLVPQDAGDEPASALLNRIRAERAEAPVRPSRRRSAHA